MDDKIIEAVKNEAKDGKLPCKRALELATELGCEPKAIGDAANSEKIKIEACSLGCF
jgi:hypothetical protein